MVAIYFLVALVATICGAMTGMGGGVIIKPTLDMLGHYDAASINALSSFTVLAMALVSVGRRVRSKSKVDVKIAVPLAIGSLLGGNIGTQLLTAMLSQETASNKTVVVQNIILAGLILVVFVYMHFKSRLPSLHWKGFLPACLVGCLLGVLSSFLGIGGGPINVAIITFVFSLSTKQAAECSLVTILFSQLAKVAAIFYVGAWEEYSLNMLPVMILGAVLGGAIGSRLHCNFSEKKIEAAFNVMQLVVLSITIIVIVRYV